MYPSLSQPSDFTFIVLRQARRDETADGRSILKEEDWCSKARERNAGESFGVVSVGSLNLQLCGMDGDDPGTPAHELRSRWPSYFGPTAVSEEDSANLRSLAFFGVGHRVFMAVKDTFRKNVPEKESMEVGTWLRKLSSLGIEGVPGTKVSRVSALVVPIFGVVGTGSAISSCS